MVEPGYFTVRVLLTAALDISPADLPEQAPRGQPPRRLPSVEIASLVLSVVAIAVAGASAVYAKRQAASAARQAAEAEKVTAIEQKRLHVGLMPVIALTCETQSRDGRQAQMTLELTGPAGLDRLDEVRVRIRDDMPRQPTPGSLQAEEHWEEVIWGPYRIRSGLRDTDANGREHGPFPLPRNEPYRIPLEHSFAPPWQTDWQSWRSQYQNAPVRLEIICVRHGYEPWTLTPEVKVHYGPEFYLGVA